MNLNYNFIENLLKLNKSEKDLLIDKLVNQIKTIHLEKSNKNNWIEVYQTHLNYSLYKHGLIKKPGLEDYIITDYIKDNMYILKNRELSRVILDNSLLKIKIEKSNFELEASNKFEDKIKDMIELNIIAFYDPEFARELLNKMISMNNRNKFLKIFSVYTAHLYLDLKIKKNELSNEKDKLYIQELLDFIFYSYEEFTNYIPKWLN